MKRIRWALAIGVISASTLAADMGVKMNLVMQHQTAQANGAINTQSVEMNLWSHFNEKSSYALPNGHKGAMHKFDLQLLDGGETVTLVMNLYAEDGGASKLVSQPKLTTKYGHEATIEIGEEAGEKVKIVVLPVKAEQPKQS